MRVKRMAKKRRKTAIVYEVNPFQFVEKAKEAKAKGLKDIDILSMCTSLTADDLKTMPVSEIRKVFDAFSKKNRTLFDFLRWTELDKYAAGMIRMHVVGLITKCVQESQESQGNPDA